LTSGTGAIGLNIAVEKSNPCVIVYRGGHWDTPAPANGSLN